MVLSRPSIIILIIVSLIFFGCATVHQPPGIDSEKMTKFQPPTETDAASGSTETSFQFDLSIEEAVNAIAYACFELEIPLYYPLVTGDKREARLVSGPIIARCGLDCDCTKAITWASGPASDVASGTILVRLFSTLSGDREQVLVEISSMFFRTESTGGEYSRTYNLYFDSLGRIENVILEKLAEDQVVKSQQ